MMIPNTEGRLRIVTEKGQWLQNEDLEARTFINTPSVYFCGATEQTGPTAPHYSGSYITHN
jgi:hypothetical protein